MKPFPTPNDCHFSPWTGCAPLHIETWQGINKLIVGVHCKIEKANIENIAMLEPVQNLLYVLKSKNRLK